MEPLFGKSCQVLWRVESRTTLYGHLRLVPVFHVHTVSIFHPGGRMMGIPNPHILLFPRHTLG